ncbi:2-C-methyl-D-erythritol 4-phosphate cytidylyltransferase [Smaragdicoccus niigatensis]|uniref:2-C-methyl-D-erythritol 4-phosphate cytidylyltransferase n=1 Tax=Smaragdicoccus niigatensis TaxID=359359 RepID=UPI000684B6F0|nr:2-C-methyl-D-erythritol 4-phosphate cytidylyltransferase [Smaragdicoccus niigatensis]
MKIVAIVPAAGQGLRLGESIPKAFVRVGSRTMLELSVRALLDSGVVDQVVVSVPAELVDEAAALVPDATVVTGGAERADSVRAGVEKAPDASYYLVHDAARALTPPSLIRRVVDELHAGQQAVVPALPVADTVKTVNAQGDVTDTLDRSQLRAIQTPQGFEADLLRKAYEPTQLGDKTTDDAGLVEKIGGTVRTIDGDPMAFKVTTQMDLRIARALVSE